MTFFKARFSASLPPLHLYHQLTTSEEQLKKLQFFKSVVAPLVESYWVSACGLLWLRNQSFAGKNPEPFLFSRASFESWPY